MESDEEGSDYEIDSDLLYDEINTVIESNTEKLDDIESRKENETTIFRECLLRFKRPSPEEDEEGDGKDLSFWEILSETKTITRSLSKAIDDWRYSGEPLDKEVIVIRHCADLSVKKYEDLSRVNDTLIKLAEKYSKLQLDDKDAQDASQNILCNLKKLQQIIDEVHQLTLEDHDVESLISSGMEEIISGFRKVSQLMPTASLSLEACESEEEHDNEDEFPEDVPKFKQEDTDTDIESGNILVPNFPHSFNESTCLTCTRLQLKTSSLALNHFAFEEKNYLVCAGDDAVIRLWSIEDNCLHASYSGHKKRVSSLAIYRKYDVPYVASGSYDKTIKLWNCVDNVLVGTIHGHSGAICALSVYESKKNRPILVSGSDDKKIKLWDLHYRSLIATLQGHSGWIRSLLFLDRGDDQNYIISGAVDSQIKIWGLDDHRLVTTLNKHSAGIESLVLLKFRDITILVSGSSDSTIRLWELDKFACVRTLTGHDYAIWTLSVIKCKGKTCLASGDWGGFVKIWNLDDCSEIKSFTQKGTITSIVAIQTDETSYLVTAGNKNGITMWSEKKACQSLLKTSLYTA